MGALILPSRFTQQPQQPAPVDIGNPLTRGLSYASAIGAGGPDIAATVGSVSLVAGYAGLADAMSPGNYKISKNTNVGKSAKGTIVVLHNSTVLPPSGPTYSHVLASTAPSAVSQNCVLLMLGNNSGYLQFRVYGNTAGAQDGAADSTRALNDGKPHITIATYDMSAGGTLATYVDNVNVSSGTHPNAITPSSNLVIGHSRDTFWGDFQGNITATLFFDRVLSRTEIASISTNPWQLFKAPPRRLWVAAPPVADTTLAGTASTQAAASGALTTSIRMAGSAAATAYASGALSTAVQLAGAATASASANGSLTTAVRLAGASVTQAGAAGSLSTQIALSGTAAASASAGGTLTTGIRLTGAATAQASASGSLGAAGAVLSGAAVSTASASGALLTTIRMAGLASASASVSGSLATSIRLSGAAVAQATASGTLGGIIAVIPEVPASRTVNFGGGSNRVDFDGGTNRVNFDGGTNRVDFGGAINKVEF